jgi:hypothetical protein
MLIKIAHPHPIKPSVGVSALLRAVFDHDKYAKVGGGENFLLKFRKIGGRSQFHAAQL